MFVGRFGAHSDSTSKPRVERPVFDASYRSHAGTHKVLVQAKEPELRDAIIADGGSVVEDYGAFLLMSAPGATAERVSLQSTAGSSVRDDLNVLLLRAGAFDTTEGEPVSLSSLGESDSANEQLYLVQFIGPIKKRWINELKSCADIVSYIPNNAYLVRANATGRAQLESLRAAGNYIQWTGAYKPAYKIAPEFQLDVQDEVTATVQIVSSDEIDADVQELVSRSSSTIINQPAGVLNYTNLRIKVEASRLAEIARMSNVVWIEPWSEPVLHDEKQGLILAGKLTGSEQPSSYISWLQSKGIASSPDFGIDIADTGIDQGILDPAVLHKDFLNASGLARVSYARFMGQFDGEGVIPQDYPGHGTINASIAGGYGVNSAFPWADSDGYKFGVGIHPYARLGVTQIFAPSYTNPSFTEMVNRMYGDGARVSNNSWGTYNNTYTADCQTYDSLVRDAQSDVQGNQEITIVFSSGNKGPRGNLTSPGSAKNTITVGASENLRSGVDGCGIDSTGADDVNSLINFSSGGPTTDGRTKPDICAPGTHIQGARSQSRGYNAAGVCGPGNYPLNQTWYTWSSGTSHAAPAVAGGAAILRQLFQQTVGHAPSPALIKAYLTNSASYMNGFMASDNLPGANQGWGLMSLARALDGVPRLLVDQDKMISNTGQVTTVQGKVSDPSKPFRVTLAWTDAPGNAAANPSVNDLDLQVDIGGQTYLGNHFNGAVSTSGGTADHLNNIESIWAPPGSSGDFTIRIVGANIAGDGVPGNGDNTDQDFALVVYNVQGQGGGPLDSPPNVSLISPVGGEQFTVGNTIQIQWAASDDKGITSQKIEFSPDGSTFNAIATLGPNARSFDWRVPGWPTSTARIRVTVMDGVNLPVSSASRSPFGIVNGPPDTTPPAVTLLSHNSVDPLGGGTNSQIKWRETDNVGVIKRVIEVSLDNGNSYQEIVTLNAPSSGETQTFDWPVPADLWTGKAKVRVTLYDGAGNSASASSNKNFEIWPMPIINGASVTEGDKLELEIAGRYFRPGETEIWVGEFGLRKLQYDDRYFMGNGMYKHISSFDKKLNKRVPDRRLVRIELRNPSTGQVSPVFEFKRKKPAA
jgi:Subtilase family/Bacterial Ig domain